MMTAAVKRLTIGLGAGLVALTAVAGAFVHAQDRPGGPGGSDRFGGRGGPGRLGGPGGRGGAMGMLPGLARDIELTDAQQDQIKTIAESHKDEWKALADRARSAHRALNDTVTADAIDEALIRQKSAEVAAVDAEMAVARARAHAEVWQILSADQKAKLKARAEMKRRATRREPR